MDVTRFFSKVEITGFCWNWKAGLSHGYGAYWHEGRKVRAHTYCYELLVGPAPEGLQPDHLCRNTRCVNPDHIEWVTQAENNHRAFGGSFLNSQKTRCPQGHEYDEDNTYVNAKGSRICRQCNNGRNAKRAQCPVCEYEGQVPNLYRHTRTVHGFKYGDYEE